jgi:hypothetical protein
MANDIHGGATLRERPGKVKTGTSKAHWNGRLIFQYQFPAKHCMRETDSTAADLYSTPVFAICEYLLFVLAPRLLSTGMTGSQSAVRSELKAIRHLLVRFAHAPSVKLTLEPRPAPAAPRNTRLLRLTGQTAFEGR